jgi:hypothetical protein
MNTLQSSLKQPIYAIKDSNALGSFLLRIADLTVEVSHDRSMAIVGVEGAKENFIAHDVAPDVRIRATTCDLPEESEGTLLFDSGPVWKLYQADGSHIFRFGAPSFGSKPYKIAIFNPDFSDGEVFIHPHLFQPGRPVDPLWGPLDELLYGNLLARGRGVEVHACGLIDPQGQGRLFVGVSTAGKTTMARLWEKISGVTVLSDDRIILRKKGDKIWMYGTPWHGEGGQSVAASVPVTGIYFLKKSAQNGLALLKEHDTVSRFFTCSFLPLYSREAVDFTLGFLGEIAQKVPCFELSVVPDKAVVDFVRKGLSDA